MNRSIVVFLSLAFIVPMAVSQQRDTAPEPAVQTAPEAQQEAEQPRRDAESSEVGSPQSGTQSSVAKPNESFVPTEDISEDLSVSFPVDI